MFVQFTFAKQLWFWMGACQALSPNWRRFKDIIHFSCQLPTKTKTTFLLIISAVCWTIWKHKNDICFNLVPSKQPRHIIFLILSLVVKYWSGHVRQQIWEETAIWLSVNTDEIPINNYHLDNEYHMVEYAYGGICRRQHSC